MNKTVKILAVISIFSFLFLASSSFAQEREYQKANRLGPLVTVCVPYERTGLELSEASWLIGQRVYSPLGGELGQIDDLMIDRTNGQIALVILSGVQGFGPGYVAAPFSALERTGANTFELNFDNQYISIPLSNVGPLPAKYEDPYAYELYKNRSVVGLSTISSRIDPLWADSLYQFYGQRPYWTEGKAVPPDIMAYRASEPSMLKSLFGEKSAPALMDSTVESKGRKTEARIDDLVIDSNDGRVAFLVLDKVPGRGDMQVAVPFSELSRIDHAYVLNITGDRLAAAPSFDQYTDMNNLRWAENVYRFFGERPCWTE
jgi:sporulation protein YlmC with PRC-barrel domain